MPRVGDWVMVDHPLYRGDWWQVCEVVVIGGYLLEDDASRLWVSADNIIFCPIRSAAMRLRKEREDAKR